MIPRAAGRALLRSAGARRQTLALARSAQQRGLREPLVLSCAPSLKVSFFSTEKEAASKEEKDKAPEAEPEKEAPPEKAEEAQAAEPEASSEELEELRQNIAVLKEQLAELKEKHDSIKLDSKQQAKRHLTDLDNETKYGFSKFAKALLQIPDNLERASGSLKEEDLEQDAELRRMRDDAAKAHELVREALEHCGVVKMDCLDKAFDPQSHEAMFAMEMPGKDPNTIFHVMEPGYMIYDRTLRAAKVGVTR